MRTWWGEGAAPESSWSEWRNMRPAQQGHYARVAAYAARWPPQAGEDELTSCELSITSQNGEDGVLAEIVRRVGSSARTFVEFGVESGAEGNCICLADIRGWTGWFLEADGSMFRQLAAKYAWSDRVHTLQEFLTPANVDAVLMRAGVPSEIDVLSIDIDGADCLVWNALEAVRPRIVVIEYNAALDPLVPLVPRDPSKTWDGTQNFGSSLAAMLLVADRKGYDLVHLESAGVNAFFVRRDLAWTGPTGDQVVRRTPNYFLHRRQHAGFDQSHASFELFGGGRL